MSGRPQIPKPVTMRNKKAVVLLSGGIDSSTTLYYALDRGYKVHALIFDYGQRHKREIISAKKIARHAEVDYKVVRINLPWGGSVLLNKKAKFPRAKLQRRKIPPTYVPARNTIFLSFALSFAETIGAQAVFIGANAVDFSGYPNCRPEFIKAFQKLALIGTKSGLEGRKIKILAPLINLKKSEIIKLGIELGVPFKVTWSCYKGSDVPCQVCDSCLIRKKGFEQAGREDPLWKN